MPFFILLSIFIDFNNKIMISRTARKTQEQMLPVSHQETGRKFGGVVNRQQKSPLISGGRFQDNSKIYGQKSVKQFDYNQNLELSAYEADKKYIVSTLQPTNLNQSVSMTTANDQKKDKQNRNRQFIAKVDSINKIHDQINSLLKLVKNGQSKSVIKPKQVPIQRSKTIDNIHKQRIKDELAYRPIAEEKIQESMITPVTQKDRSFTDYRKNYNMTPVQDKSQQENLRRMHANNYYNISSPNLQNLRQSPSKMSEQLMRRLNEAKDYRNKSPKHLDSNTKKSQIPIKTPQIQKHNDLTAGKSKYNYNCNSNEDPVQILKSRNFVKQRNEKQDKKMINYDYQIAKVKQRIQTSEQITKKMQQKYFRPDHTNTKVKEQNKNRTRAERKSYLNINIDDMQQKSGNFQLKVYPCKTDQKFSKSQLCKLIAAKLSDQLKLDQKLRDARELFNDCKIPDKWKALQTKLKQFGLSFSQSQLENQLNISSNQSNPFHDDLSKKRNPILELAETFSNSQEYWQKRFCKFLSRKTMENSGFKVSQMDLDQRGYLTVEDLVCFVNLHSSNFFRNRDMIYLFRRIMALGKNRNGVDYQNFANIISSD